MMLGSSQTLTSRFHQILANIPGARSTWRLGLALKAAWVDNPDYSREELLRDYGRPVAWAYSTDELEIERHRHEMDLLDRAVGTGRFHKAMEIGCAEGVFTELLAGRCDSLIATDFLEVALERARQRLKSAGHVDFSLLDLRVDPLPGGLDLICLIHVLDYVRSPLALRKIREKIVTALKPGGYLLLGSYRMDPCAEEHWWSPYLIRGGRRINAFFAAHPKLTLLDSATLPHPRPRCEFIDALFQKTQ